MTALRKIVDSNVLTSIFDLPPTLQNRKIEVVLFPADEETEKIPFSTQKKPFQLTLAQIDEWAKAFEIQTLVGALAGTNLPSDISINDIREQRLADKYRV
ncbi:hypothetical protein R84B8_03098 [Treponema sp. R8-4-B8]